MGRSPRFVLHSPQDASPPAPSPGSTGSRGLEPPVGRSPVTEPPASQALQPLACMCLPNAAHVEGCSFRKKPLRSANLQNAVSSIWSVSSEEFDRRLNAASESQGAVQPTFGPGPLQPLPLYKHCAYSVGIYGIIRFCVQSPTTGSIYCEDHRL